MNDLNILLKDIQAEHPTLVSNQYTAKHKHFISQLNQLLIKKSAIETSYQRNLILYKEKVIALADFENIKTEYDQSVGEVATHLREYTHQLESDLIAYQKEIREIAAQISQIRLQNEETVILAPIHGNISKIFGISNQTYLQAGQQILEISPDGELMAECILPSKDIGYIIKGQSVRIQIDAFNYNEWGMLSGNVTEIYNDIVISDDQKMAYFKVYCNLDSHKLYLKNGFSGEVRKGMSAFVLFIVTKRTLANLLYDKLDNWLNPNVKPA